MAQARDRLGTRQVFALEIDLGLVPELEPAFTQRLIDLDRWAYLIGRLDRGHKALIRAREGTALL
jgi:hypothetical protein